MHSALLLTLGTQEDHEPAIALAVGLVSSGKFDSVHLVIQSEYLYLVPFDRRIIPHVLPIAEDLMTNRLLLPHYLQYVMMKAICLFGGGHHHKEMKNNKKKVRNDQMNMYNKYRRSILVKVVIPSLPMIHGIAIEKRPTVIIATSLMHPVGVTVAEYLSIPIMLLQFRPVTPTTRFPHLLMNTSASILAAQLVAELHQVIQQSSSSSSLSRVTRSPHAMQNEDSHTRSYSYYNRSMISSSLARLNALRSRLHLPQLHPDARALSHHHLQKPIVLNAFPTQLVPRIPEHPSSVLQIPALAADYIPPGWNPETHCPNLVAFFSNSITTTNHDRINSPSTQFPICVVFGRSFFFDNGRKFLRKLLLALRAHVSSVIILHDSNDEFDVGTNLLSSCFDDFRSWITDHVFYCNERPHFAWIFPKCRAVICNGSVHTISAALHAGVPILAIPTFGDQYFWATLISCLNLGAAVIPDLYRSTSASATATAIESSLATVLSKHIANNVAKAGQAMRAKGNGALIAANLIAKLLQRRT